MSAPVVHEFEHSGLRLSLDVTESFAVVVHAAGEIDLATMPAFDQRLGIAEKLVVPPAPLVVDLVAVNFMSSYGLRVLVEHHESCRAAHVPFRLVADRRLVRTLRVTGLDSRLPPFTTVGDALAPDRLR